MSVAPRPSDGASRFMADLANEGHEPVLDGAVIRYAVVPLGGRFAGEKVETGISVSEVQSWPMVPPHWIHLRDEIQFSATNSDTTDCGPGWRRHSRDTGPWSLDRPAILVWIAHVRGVTGQAL